MKMRMFRKIRRFSEEVWTEIDSSYFPLETFVSILYILLPLFLAFLALIFVHTFIGIRLLPTAREGNVFRGVYHSVQNRPRGYSSLLWCNLKASYWNVFLLILVQSPLINGTTHICNRNGRNG